MTTSASVAQLTPVAPLTPVASLTKEAAHLYFGARANTNMIFFMAFLTATITQKKSNMYVSYCPALDLYSQGDTLEEAKESIVEATVIFIETCFECGTLNEVLVDCGFRLTADKHLTAEKPHQQHPKQESTAHNPKIVVFQFPAHIPIEAQIPVVEHA